MNRRFVFGSYTAAIVWLTFVVGAIYGWVANIFSILAVDQLFPLTTLLVLRFVGVVVVPLGAILGYV